MKTNKTRKTDTVESMTRTKKTWTTMRKEEEVEKKKRTTKMETTMRTKKTINKTVVYTRPVVHSAELPEKYLKTSADQQNS